MDPSFGIGIMIVCMFMCVCVYLLIGKPRSTSRSR